MIWYDLFCFILGFPIFLYYYVGVWTFCRYIYFLCYIVNQSTANRLRAYIFLLCWGKHGFSSWLSIQHWHSYGNSLPEGIIHIFSIFHFFPFVAIFCKIVVLSTGCYLMLCYVVTMSCFFLLLFWFFFDRFSYLAFLTSHNCKYEVFFLHWKYNTKSNYIFSSVDAYTLTTTSNSYGSPQNRFSLYFLPFTIGKR